MRTQTALSLLTDRQRSTIDLYKANYRAIKDDIINRQNKHHLLAEYRASITGYLTALEDCGIITQAQARALYSYTTL